MTFSGLPVSHLNNVTDLDVQYCPSPNFLEHARTNIAKARKMTSFVLRNLTTCEIRIALLNMCVRPILEYNCTLFSIFRNSDLEGIESVHRVFTRHLLIHKPRISYYERFSQLQTEPLGLRCLKLNLKFLFETPIDLIHCEKAHSPSSSLSCNIRNNEITLEIPNHRSALHCCGYVLSQYLYSSSKIIMISRNWITQITDETSCYCGQTSSKSHFVSAW